MAKKKHLTNFFAKRQTRSTIFRKFYNSVVSSPTDRENLKLWKWYFFHLQHHRAVPHSSVNCINEVWVSLTAGQVLLEIAKKFPTTSTFSKPRFLITNCNTTWSWRISSIILSLHVTSGLFRDFIMSFFLPLQQSLFECVFLTRKSYNFLSISLKLFRFVDWKVLSLQYSNPNCNVRIVGFYGAFPIETSLVEPALFLFLTFLTDRKLNRYNTRQKCWENAQSLAQEAKPSLLSEETQSLHITSIEKDIWRKICSSLLRNILMNIECIKGVVLKKLQDWKLENRIAPALSYFVSLMKNWISLWSESNLYFI